VIFGLLGGAAAVAVSNKLAAPTKVVSAPVARGLTVGGRWRGIAAGKSSAAGLGSAGLPAPETQIEFVDEFGIARSGSTWAGGNGG
jgi:hypothetical protein